MSGSGSSRPPRTSLPSSVNDVAARMRQMDLRNDPPHVRVAMPQAQIWSPPPALSSDGKPLPSLPNGSSVVSPLPPRVRPVHLGDRPNPYDPPPPYAELGPVPTPPAILSPPSFPPPMMMPTPSPWEEDRPTRIGIAHTHSDPPPIIRTSYNPPPRLQSGSSSAQPPTIPQYNQHSPLNRPSAQHRYSNPATPSPSVKPTTNQLAVPPPSKPGHGRSSSAPPSPLATKTNSFDGGVQCSGVTKTGKRCTRAIKSPHPFNQATDAADGDIEVR